MTDNDVALGQPRFDADALRRRRTIRDDMRFFDRTASMAMRSSV